MLRVTDLDAIRPLGFSRELAVASVEWLHALLRDLAGSGFVAPAPVPDLDGRSIVVLDGALCELLTFIPGEPMGWADDQMQHAGRLLARLHAALATLPTRGQRPGALPISACRPTEPIARDIRRTLERELSEIGYEHAPRSVVHGDATQANVVIDGPRYALVDYAIAYQEPALFDIASALWRNGRVDANAVTYDPRRAAIFVGGYHRERPLAETDSQAIVTYMKGRGLQLQQRLELRRGDDDTVIARLRSVCAQEHELGAEIAAAIG